MAACVMTFEARDNAAKVVPSTGCSQMEERKSARKMKVSAQELDLSGPAREFPVGREFGMCWEMHVPDGRRRGRNTLTY